MKYVISCSDAPTFYLTLPSFHFTTLTYPSHPHELVSYAPKTFSVDGSLGNSGVPLTRIENYHEFRETL
jgi:hypothetical protein